MNGKGRRPDGPDPSLNDAAGHILGMLLASMFLYGGIGWLVGRWLGIPILLPIGLIAGIIIALYLVYVRYGRS